MTPRRTSLLVASALFVLGLGPAHSQDTRRDSPAPELPPPEVVTPEGGDETPSTLPEGLLPALPDEREAAREGQLDALFRELADSDNRHWQATQNQIMLQWRQSGSASMDLLLDRALTAMEAEDFDRALAFLDDLVRLAPEFAEGWNQRATVRFLMGDYGHSIADIRRTLALEPRHFGALAGLGIILDRLGQDEGALRAFRRVLELHPNMPGAQEGVKRLAPDVDGRPL